VPYKGTKGRAGDAVYKTLCHPDNKAKYPWARSHTWQSWSNRYRKNQESFDRKISRYLESHREILSQWDPTQSYSKKAARKLGFDTTARAFHSASDSDESASDGIPPEEHEADQELLDGDEFGSASPVARSPNQNSRSRRTTARPRWKVTPDYNEFPEVKEGDDSAPPRWTKRRRTESPVDQLNPKLHRSLKGKRTAMRQHPGSRPDGQLEQNNKGLGRFNGQERQVIAKAPIVKIRFALDHNSS
jgi:hypothetical protein